MKAFLSHSSKDKDFVSAVYNYLGPILSEYDECTFDFTLNVSEIRKSIARSDVFVAFLSKNSISSTFIKEEYRQALEAIGRGNLASAMVFALDETSYKSLPEWLRELNVVTRLSSPQTCARRIQARLMEVDASKHDGDMIYLGRDSDEAVVRKALAVPPASMPLALHVVGHHGIGRRTFLEKTLKKILPRVFTSIVPVNVQKHDGPEELYRALYALNEHSSLGQMIEAFSAFSKLEISEQAEKIASQIHSMSDGGEFVMIIDDGGVYDEEGNYQPIFASVLDILSDRRRPMMAFVQTRMMPAGKRAKYRISIHHYLKPLDDESVKEILSFLFQELEIDYSTSDLLSVVDLLDGHPYNIRFAAEFVASYGLASLIADPSHLVEWKRRRAGDYLEQIGFSAMEGDVLALLTEYRHVADDMVPELVGGDPVESVEALRRLQDFCCVELREGYFYVSPPVRDAIAKDDRFQRDATWKRTIGAQICAVIGQYKDSDQIPVSIIESATIAAAQGATAPAFISALILPSHLLRIGRDHYDRKRWSSAIQFCQRALEGKNRLPDDAQVEALRIVGLAASRIDRQDIYQDTLSDLETYASAYARRITFFVMGFYERQNNRLDLAEKYFKEAWKFSKNNESINRELANIYCKQKRYEEAEPYARAAYDAAPTSPYILDILAETLLGKERLGLPVDLDELSKVLDGLRRYGDAPGSSFYLVRLAQQLVKSGNIPGAIEASARAIERTPELLAPYFMRAEALLADKQPREAEKDLATVKSMLAEAGGASEGDQVRAIDLEVSIMIEKELLGPAKLLVDRSRDIPSHVRNRLLLSIARSIAFSPNSVDSQLRGWGKSYLSK